MLVLWGRAMGTKEVNARLREQVTQQAEGLSILENTRLGKYFFLLSTCWFLPLA